jgi:molybdate transport system substrate-binding protein
VVVAALPLLVGANASASVEAKAPKLTGSITVSAAASLTESFTKLGADFEKKNKGTKVTFNFGSSSTLVTQITGGAPADVFASADLTSMDKLVTAGKVTASPTIIARNQLEIAVKPGNPKSIKTLADLAKAGTIALCGATVPCGVYAANVLSRANVTIPTSSITRGADAKATLAAVSPGDANAALVYVTDVKAAGTAVQGVMIPDDQNTVAVYPAAPLASTSNAKLAKAFVAHVASPTGQKTLATYGFLAP